MNKYTYEVILIQNDNVGGYTITVPDLPGCVTEGDNLDEALIMLDDALKTYTAELIYSGQAIPTPTFGRAKPLGGTIMEVSFELTPNYSSNNHHIFAKDNRILLVPSTNSGNLSATTCRLLAEIVVI